MSLALDLASYQKNNSVALTTAAVLLHKLIETRDERLPRTLRKHLSSARLPIGGELGYALLTAHSADLVFEMLSRRYEHSNTRITYNLPIDEWLSVFGSERLTGALSDRQTHHAHVLDMIDESFRLTTTKKSSDNRNRNPTA